MLQILPDERWSFSVFFAEYVEVARMETSPDGRRWAQFLISGTRGSL
jgi:hypothetical protein